MKRLLLATTAALLLATPVLAADALTRADVEAIVKETLEKNPEMITAALQKAQVEQQKAQLTKAKDAIKKRQKDLVDDPSAPVVGNKKADTAVVFFFDYHCGYCKRALPTVQDLLKKDKNLKVVFKEYPILSEDSTLASKAALAVYQVAPDKYFDYHQALMNTKGKYDLALVTAEAKKLGISEAKFEKAMDSAEVADELAKTKTIGGELGVRGTPAFIIGEQIIPGAVSLETLQEAIKDARAAKKKS